MRRVRRTVVSASVLLGLLLGASGHAQTPAEPARPHKSVYGKLESVNESQNAVVMNSDGGERLAWKFDAAVVAEVAKFKPGDAMIVIYRQTAANEKKVTAVAFPGAAAKPTYLNMTGDPVHLRSAPMVGGVCGQEGAGRVTEFTIPDRGLGEAVEACWCCAAAGQSCTPGNKSGAGKALLVQCFK